MTTPVQLVHLSTSRFGALCTATWGAAVYVTHPPGTIHAYTGYTDRITCSFCRVLADAAHQHGGFQLVTRLTCGLEPDVAAALRDLRTSLNLEVTP